MNNNDIENVTSAFFNRCMGGNPLPRRVLKAMTDDEFEGVSNAFCEEFETGRETEPARQLTLAETFARAASRINLDRHMSHYIYTPYTDAGTAQALEKAGAPHLARVVRTARARAGLDNQ